MALIENAQTEKEKTLARSIGEGIAAYRKAVKIDQKELARRLHVKPSTLNRWETGYTPISVYDLLRVAEVFHIPASWLLGETHMEDVSAHHLQQSYQCLTPAHQSVLLTLLRELLRLKEGGDDADRSKAGPAIENEHRSDWHPARLLEAE